MLVTQRCMRNVVYIDTQALRREVSCREIHMQNLRHRRGEIEEDFFRTRRGQPNRSPLSDRAVYDATDQTGHKRIARADRDANLRLGLGLGVFILDHSAAWGEKRC